MLLPPPPSTPLFPLSSLSLFPLILLPLHTPVQDIGRMLSLASDAVEELSKEKPSGEMVEYKTKDFLKTLEVCTQELLPPLLGNLEGGKGNSMAKPPSLREFYR